MQTRGNEGKSFYDLDYIIELSEKRNEQYTNAYESVLGRLTNFIIIYTVLGIYLVPIIQDIWQISSIVFRIGVALFVGLISISVFYTIRFIIPLDISYLQQTSSYYQDLRVKYEDKIFDHEMSTDEKSRRLSAVNNLLKSSYIDELDRTQTNNGKILSRKGSFYFNALVWGLFAILPYIVCVGFHITKNNDGIQKVELIKPGKTVSCHS